MTLPERAKPFNISKQEVRDAWKKVKSNRGAAGVDGISLKEFESELPRNLYKLWNRLSSGSYFPQAVRRVEIPKKDGSNRPLGIPTVFDRVAQEVARNRLEKRLEPLFHEDSYGYRAGKSAIEAVRVCRERNWKHDWVLDVDIQKFYETINHKLLLKAVRKHCQERWVILYIERWLKAPIQYEDGRVESSQCGTPQGGVISPLLANLYLHYAFDAWMTRAHPTKKFERYADDIVIHCRSERQARFIRTKLEERLAECHLSLHPEKTHIVYCKDSHRREDYPNITYTFLGYYFRPRSATSGKSNERFTSFLPAASSSARKRLMNKLREMQITRLLSRSIEDLAERMNPVLRGWFNYFSNFYEGALAGVKYNIDRMLVRWVQRKYRKPRRSAVRWLAGVRQRSPDLFAHW